MDESSRPHVLIIGGFLTEPFMYQPMRRRLLEQGAARVSVAPVHLPDWAALVFGSMGPLSLRGGRAIRRARRVSPAPLIVVGHSLGGTIARLSICDVPLDGRRAAVADDVGCLVTLGTPHRFEPRLPWRHAAVRAADHLERHCPPARNVPTTACLTVGSVYVQPAQPAPIRSWLQLANRLLRDLVGETPGIAGDGLIGDDRCRLDGVPHVTLDDVLHGVHYGPWYGDTEIIERWWPAAVEAWRAALGARVAAA